MDLAFIEEKLQQRGIMAILIGPQKRVKREMNAAEQEGAGVRVGEL